MGIAERAFTHDALERQSLVIGLVKQGSNPSPVADATGRTQWAAISCKVLGEQGSMVMLGDIATAGICLGFIREELAAWLQAV